MNMKRFCEGYVKNNKPCENFEVPNMGLCEYHLNLTNDRELLYMDAYREGDYDEN